MSVMHCYSRLFGGFVQCVIYGLSLILSALPPPRFFQQHSLILARDYQQYFFLQNILYTCFFHSPSTLPPSRGASCIAFLINNKRTSGMSDLFPV